MDNREGIARIIDRFSCTRWDAGAKHDLKTEILSLLTRTEATTGEVERLREAWRDGWAECKGRLTDDEAFCLTDDVEDDAWLDSKTRAALAQPVQDEPTCICGNVPCPGHSISEADKLIADNWPVQDVTKADEDAASTIYALMHNGDPKAAYEAAAAHRRAFSREGGDA